MALADLMAGSERFLACAEERRVRASLELDLARRSNLGQYFTPLPVATLMAGMADPVASDSIRVLDPGAGAGSLTSALIQAICQWTTPPQRIEATLVEADPRLEPPLRETIADCEALCAERGVAFDAEVRVEDFLKATASAISAGEPRIYDLAILNPPYRKIGSGSRERMWARGCGVEVSNIYAAFMAATVASLMQGGQMVAITPRSFTNGTYFRHFRHFLLDRMELAKVHVFDSRDEAFRDDGVLQENIVVHAKRGSCSGEHRVLLSASRRPGEPIRSLEVPVAAVIDRTDPEAFIHLPVDNDDAEIARRMARLPARLEDLRLTVSTGPVVDFRVRDYLRQAPHGNDAVPLLYPTNVRQSEVLWPMAESRKPCAIVSTGEARKWLVPDGDYVLVRRFSAKEERRRVVAGVLCKGQLGYDEIGLENHLNYFHQDGQGMKARLAQGLAAYLNSSFVDRYIRLFNGHTQVNASDLRALRYPSAAQLEGLARAGGSDSGVEGLMARFSAAPTRE